MSEAHSDTSQKWLIFFFVCFASSVLAIGLWACFCYDVKEATKPPGAGGGGHSMIMPEQIPSYASLDLA